MNAQKNIKLHRLSIRVLDQILVKENQISNFKNLLDDVDRRGVKSVFMHGHIRVTKSFLIRKISDLEFQKQNLISKYQTYAFVIASINFTFKIQEK